MTLKAVPLFAIALIAGALSVLQIQSAVAETVRVDSEGITIENGTAKVQLSFPELMNGAKAVSKISEKSVTEKSAVLRYEGGGQIAVTAKEDSIVFETSEIPAGINHITGSVKLPVTSYSGGKWKADDASGSFPDDKAEKPNLYEGNPRLVSFIGRGGPDIRLGVPANTYQQVQDLRFYHTNAYFYKYWMTYAPGTNTYTILLGDAARPAKAGDKPSATTSAPLPAAVTPAPSSRLPDTSARGTTICKWKDGKKACFMIVFDDSIPCHLKIVVPLLDKYKIPGTFYVNPGLDPFQRRKAEWTKAAESPYIELANHTSTHKGINSLEELDNELSECSKVIYECTPQKKNPRLIGFGQPGGVPWKATKEETNTALEKAHLVNRPPFYGLPFHYKTSAELVAVVDKAISKGEMGHIDFHGVGEDWLKVPTEFLTTLLDKLTAEQAQVWTTDTVSWRKYTTELQTADIKVLQKDAGEIRLELSSAADPAFYDLPLTLSTIVPDDWKECEITQGSTKIAATAANGKIQYDALPGKEPISIKPTKK
ncbi:MAG TPA: polysaccharide deacetylase family protein [Candidatus Methylacidiphilales bacterium]|nr:polysaccharide deacetylase family protein [Candidatus Methylacidiphilales bacterium]